MKTNKKIAFIFLVLWCASSYTAAAEFAGDSVISTIKSAMEGASAGIARAALIWLGAFATIQLVITNIGLLRSGADIEAVFGKFLGSLAWVGFCIYALLNGADFINSVGKGLFNIIDGQLLSASDILIKALATALKIFGVVIIAAALPGIGNTVGPFFTYVLIFFLAVSVLFAFKIFMVQLELGLIVMLAPLSFSFLGLNALKDQGIAPFKALISLAYRIILMMVIMKAFNSIDSVIGAALAKYAEMNFARQILPSNIEELATAIFSGLISYMLLAYLLFKSDSIAATLAAGSTNMGTADVASAAAAGAAAGAAIASGGAAAAASKPGQAMADFMKGKGGDAVNNAAPSGGGDKQSTLLSRPDVPAVAPEASRADSESKYERNSAGAPMKDSAETGDSLASTSTSSLAESKSSAGDSSDAQADADSASASSSVGGRQSARPSLRRSGPRSASSSNSARRNSDPQTAQMRQDMARRDGAVLSRDGAAASAPAAVPSGGGNKTRPDDGALTSAIKQHNPAAGGRGGNEPTPTAVGGAVPMPKQSSAGSAASAAIGGGANSDVAAALERMEAQLNKQNAPTKSSLRQAFSNANHHLAQEKATTSVSINANASD